MSFAITYARGGIPSKVDGNVYARRSDLLASVAPFFSLDLAAAAQVYVEDFDGGDVTEEWYVYRSDSDAWDDEDGTSALFVIGKVS